MSPAARPSVAASRGPVTVTLSAPSRRVPRGSTFEIALTLTIEPGWTIASVKGDPSGASRPTSVQFGAAEGLRPGAMRAPEGSVDPLGGERLAAYAGTVTIALPVTVQAGCLPGPAPVAARVLFQAARDGRTAEPDQVEVEAEFEVVPAPG